MYVWGNIYEYEYGSVYECIVSVYQGIYVCMHMCVREKELTCMHMNMCVFM